MSRLLIFLTCMIFVLINITWCSSIDRGVLKIKRDVAVTNENLDDIARDIKILEAAKSKSFLDKISSCDCQNLLSDEEQLENNAETAPGLPRVKPVFITPLQCRQQKRVVQDGKCT